MGSLDVAGDACPVCHGNDAVVAKCGRCKGTGRWAGD